MRHNKTIFCLGLLLAASGVASPAIALAGGIAFGVTTEHSFRTESSSLARLLLQASVVALGFGMNLKQVVHAGRSGFFCTAISISGAVLLACSLKLPKRRLHWPEQNQRRKRWRFFYS